MAINWSQIDELTRRMSGERMGRIGLAFFLGTETLDALYLKAIERKSATDQVPGANVAYEILASARPESVALRAFDQLQVEEDQKMRNRLGEIIAATASEDMTEMIEFLLNDPNPSVCHSAAILAERWIGEGHLESVRPFIGAMMKHSDLIVVDTARILARRVDFLDTLLDTVVD